MPSLVVSSKLLCVSWNNGGTSRPLNTDGTSGSSPLLVLFCNRLTLLDSPSEGADSVGTANREMRDLPNQEALILAGCGEVFYLK